MFGGVPSPAESDRIPSTPDAAWVVTNKPVPLQAFGADQVLHEELVLVCRGPLEQRVPLGTNPSTFTIPSSFRSKIPRELWMSLSFLEEEKLQVQHSETTATDLTMTACILE